MRLWYTHFLANKMPHQTKKMNDSIKGENLLLKGKDKRRTIAHKSNSKKKAQLTGIGKIAFLSYEISRYPHLNMSLENVFMLIKGKDLLHRPPLLKKSSSY